MQTIRSVHRLLKSHSALRSATCTSVQLSSYEPHDVALSTSLRGRLRKLQKTTLPYRKIMRLDKPTGSKLIFWPCGWSAGLGSHHLLTSTVITSWDQLIAISSAATSTVGLMAAGTVLMRGAGCTINDMWDKEIDMMVERTKSRPLPDARIDRWDALASLSLQLGASLAVLLQFSWTTVLMASPCLPLTILYPVCKRFTNWPQLALGITINWGAFLGFAAVVESFVPVSLASLNTLITTCAPLYCAGIFWTLIYDTIYAHQDRIDDATVGVKSTALIFGDQTRLCLAGFSIAMISSLVATGSNAGLGWLYYAGISGVALHTWHIIYTLNINSPPDCWQKFMANSHTGLIVFVAIWASVGSSFMGQLRSQNLPFTPY